MILGQISWLDCFIFLLCLAPQLIYQVGFFPTLFCGIRALPFLLIKLPVTFLYDHILAGESRSPFVKKASWFEDVVIRCVKYAFAYIPASIGKVFFSKYVALPFLRFRMLRHGYMCSPIHWEEIKKHEFEGLWIINDPTRAPDVVVYYAHGGGFSMGSSYFYLEVLLAFHTLLLTNTKYHNPAILALEYTLVPQASYPTQLNQAIAGYKHLLSITHDPSMIVVSGDSAGGTIILSLLLHIGNQGNHVDCSIDGFLPGLAVLMSPWTTLISPLYNNTASDYLCKETLNVYAQQYSSNKISIHGPRISPGECTDIAWWNSAAPMKGFAVIYGREEVFAPEIRKLLAVWKRASISVQSQEETGGIHAWPIASLFLCSTREDRLRGLNAIVKQIDERLDASPKECTNGLGEKVLSR